MLVDILDCFYRHFHLAKFYAKPKESFEIKTLKLSMRWNHYKIDFLFTGVFTLFAAWSVYPGKIVAILI